MFRRFIRIIVESRYSLIIGLFVGLTIFFVILFQTEIIFYFYPDVYVLNLNELFKSGVYLTLENGYGLTHGYLIVDSNAYFKALLLSSSYGIVKYKRFVRKIRPMKTEGIIRSPLNARKWKGKKPPFLVLVNSMHRHNWLMNGWLLVKLLRGSSFFQGVKLLFWEFYEKYNYNIRKRKFFRFVYAIRNVIHTFPGINVNRKSKRFRIYKNMYYQPWHLREYDRYNVVKNYSYFNVYKKFSYYIYNNFFVDRIEPYRFHNYLKRRKGYPWVNFGSYVYYKWPGYKENAAKNNSYEHVYKYRYYNYFPTPRRWWPGRVVLTHMRSYDPKGFHYNRWFFPWAENNERPDRRKSNFESHFSSFYTEKFLFNLRTTSRRKVRVMLRDLLNWNVFYRNRYNYMESLKIMENVLVGDWVMRKERKSRLFWKKKYKAKRIKDFAFGNRDRYFYWRRVFSRYGYDKRDYVFKNYNIVGNFKKYYMPTRPDFYLIPSLYKMYNLIFFFYRVYLNFINFGSIVVRRNKKYDAFFKSSDIANIYKHVLSDNKYVLYERTIFVKDKYGSYEYKRIYTLFDLLVFIFKCIKWVVNICVTIVIGICNVWYILIRDIFFVIGREFLVFFDVVKQFRLFNLIIKFIQKVRKFFYRFYYKLKSIIYIYIYKPYIYRYMRKVKNFLYDFLYKIVRIIVAIGKGLHSLFIKYVINYKVKVKGNLDPITRRYLKKRTPYIIRKLRRAYKRIIYFLEECDFIFNGGLSYLIYKFEFFFGKDYEVYKNVVNILQYIFNIESLSDYFYMLYSLNLTSLRFLFIKSFLVAFFMFFFYFIIVKFNPEEELEFDIWEWWIFIGLFLIIQILLLGSYLGYGLTIPPFDWYQL